MNRGVAFENFSRSPRKALLLAFFPTAIYPAPCFPEAFCLAASRLARRSLVALSLVGLSLVGLVLVYGARPDAAAAETLDEWLRAVPGSPSAIEFRAPDSGPPLKDTTIVLDGVTLSAIQRPSGGYLGFVRVHPPAGVSISAEIPLVLRIQYRAGDADSITIEPHGDLTIEPRALESWTVPRDIPVPPVDYEDTVRFTSREAAEAGAPIFMPPFSQRAYRSGGHGQLLVAEVASSGAPLSRRTLMTAMVGPSGRNQNVGWIARSEHADRQLRENTRTQAIETVGLSLPPAESLSELRALWVAPQMFTSSTGGDLSETDLRWARRAILLGTWIYAAPELATRLSAALRLPADSDAVLFGGLARGDIPSPQIELDRGEESFLSGSYISATEDERRSLVPHHPFAADAKMYWVWTVISVCGYAIVVLIGIPVAFLTLRRRSSNALWWTVPLGAVGCSLAIWCFGSLVLSRATAGVLIEYRLAVDDWPEAAVFSTGFLLPFHPVSATLQVPWTALPSMRQQWRTAETLSRRTLTLGESSSTTFIHELTQRGSAVTVEARGFVTAESPIRLRSADVAHVSQAFSNLFVWNNEQWRSFGPITAGSDVVLSTGSSAASPSLPYTMQSVFSHPRSARNSADEATANDDRMLRQISERLTARGVFPGSIIAIGLAANVPESSLSVSDGSPLEHRLFWIVELHVPQGGGTR